MNISDFTLRRLALEVRYNSAYLIWDRAGSIWATLAGRWPKLELTGAQPAVTSFRLEQAFEFSVTVDKSFVVQHHSGNDLEKFIEHATPFLDTLRENLGLTSYSRIGLRFTYFRAYDTKEHAATDFLSLNLLRVPEGKHFNIEGRVQHPEYSVRWESNETGITARLSVMGRKLDVILPLEAEIEPIKSETIGIEFDLDHFTTAVTSVGKFRVKDWVEQVHHSVRRDSKIFLRGT